MSIAQSMRLPFLILTPACAFLAMAFASYQEINFSVLHFVIALIGALSAHIAVNTINEYQDFQSGLDFKTIQTPFSGGSGLLPAKPHLAKKVLVVSVISVMLTAIIGSYFIFSYGWAIAPLGLVGLCIVITYTKWINRSAIICLIAPGLGFGTLIIGGTYFCITGFYDNKMWLITIIPFLLINNLLLLNQYPDIEADKSIGRRHFPIRYGVTASTAVYIIFSVLAQFVLITLVLKGYLPNFAILALLPMCLGYFSIVGMLKLGKDVAVKPQFLAANVACSILTPVVLGITLLLN